MFKLGRAKGGVGAPSPTLGAENAIVGKGALHAFVVGALKESLGRADGVGRVGDDDVELVLVLLHELGAVANVQSHLGMPKVLGHLRQVLLANLNNHLL